MTPSPPIPATLDVGWSNQPPLVVLSFNRPQYLEAVLDSLSKQVPQVDPRRIHLFQDGAVNAYSGIRYADEEEVRKCLTIFRDIFPHGATHVATANVGICENFARAENFVFKALNAPFAYFFEDDLVLSQRYISTMDVLRRDFENKPRIAYFNACGRYKESVDVQEANKSAVVDMGHIWGFALRQAHWKAMQPMMSQYLKLVVGRDYRQRPNAEIRDLFREWKYDKEATSQDSAKDIVTNALNCWRASTYVCLARYIGELGTHSTPEHFAELRFADTQIFDGELPASFAVNDGQVDAAVAAKRESWQVLPDSQ
jgi:hypothetical protein